MRPERLALSAFGPFAAEQQFDFAALGGHRLFLIHGPTGAGKTTLLDAMCFALFGSSSGDERQPAHLRSQHAAAATPTWVELDFALGPNRYRIRRSPAQPAPRKDRVVAVPPKVALWRRDGGTLTLLAEQERRVADEVQRLLGYLEREFRQVLMLPQGRFREVLTAAPSQRQAILATLFRTALYHRIEENLAVRAKGAQDAARQVEERRRTLLVEAGAATPDEAALRVEALAAEHAAAETEGVRRRAAAEQSGAALTRGQHEARILKAAREAGDALAALRGREPGMQADRDRLDAARRAAGTVAGEQLHAQAATQAEAAGAAANAAAEALRDAETRASRAGERLRDEAARAAAADAARAEAARLAERSQAVAAAELAERRASAAATALDAARDALARAERDVAAAQLAAETAEAAHGTAARLAETAGLRQQALAQLRTLAEDHAAAARLADQLVRHEAARATAVGGLDRASREHDAAVAARLAAEAGLRAHQAAHLAQGLADGVACPVCGGLDHRAPATLTDAALTDAALTGAALPDVAAAVAAEAACRTRLDAAQTVARGAEDELARAGDRLGLLRARLPDGQDPANAAGLVRDAAEAAEAAARAQAALPGLVAALTAASAAREAAIGRQRRATEAARGCEAALATERGRIAGVRDGAAPGEADSAGLTREAQRRGAEAAGLSAALDRDRRERAASDAALLAARDHAAAAAARAAQAAAERGARLAAWRAASLAAGFADPAEAAAARLPPDAIAALEAGLAAFDRALIRAAALAEQARADAAGLPMPDLAALQAAEHAARAASDAANGQVGALRERHGQAVQLLAAIRDAEAALAEARARHLVLRDVADATGGRNDRRLSLEGFVLASILDEALAAANQHLARMLGGRYRIQRRDEPARANAAIGLDIEVWDDWTGLVRPAGTLSGGEGFCAALALALGLADTVQAHAGARRIDTLFIDEGFGALDEDALDTAMDVLTGLQGGDRLVGIISHVAELRARIPAQLIVRPGQRGSTAAFAAAR